MGQATKNALPSRLIKNPPHPMVGHTSVPNLAQAGALRNSQGVPKLCKFSGKIRLSLSAVGTQSSLAKMERNADDGTNLAKHVSPSSSLSKNSFNWTLAFAMASASKEGTRCLSELAVEPVKRSKRNQL